MVFLLERLQELSNYKQGINNPRSFVYLLFYSKRFIIRLRPLLGVGGHLI